MKYALSLLALVLAGGLFRAHAEPATDMLLTVSNYIAVGYSESGDFPKTHAALGKALNDFHKPSTNAAGDFNIFIAVATHVLPLQGRAIQKEIAGNADAIGFVGALGGAMSNAFLNFTIEAMTEIAVASNRVESLNDFQRLKRPARLQIQQANRAIATVYQTSNIQIAMLSLRLAYLKVAVANKLAATAELHPGYAWNFADLAGATMTHSEGSDSGGTITFNGDETYVEHSAGDPDKPGTYTYTRTGLDTAKLTLQQDMSIGVITVTMRYLSHTNGTFTFVNTQPGNTPRGKGTFSLSN